jgi:hypothetical protein
MAAVRWRHFWILLLWFLLVLQEQCAVFGMKMTLLGNTLHFALNAFAMLQHTFSACGSYGRKITS